MSECQQNCPWNADEWKRLGRMDEKLDQLAEKQTELLHRVDALNHSRTKGAKAGLASGSAGSVFVVALYAWAKTKVDWLPVIAFALLAAVAAGYLGGLL
jgi:hypothetical protein